MTVDSRAFAIANLVMAALFGVSAVIQLNDPDPLRWMLVYGAAALACVQLDRHRRDTWLPAGVGLVAVVWIGTLAPDVLRRARPSDMVRSMDDPGSAAELAREVGGLAIVAAWMLVLLWTARRRRARAG